MRAQVFHGPGDLRFERVPVPDPAAGELVVKIEAALTCGTDVKTLRRGHPVMIPRLPTVFGHEFAGRVVKAGAGVGEFREGHRVVAANSAPCGQCRLCRAGRPNLCEDLLFVNGAYCALLGIERGRVEAGMGVVVFGHGPLGCLLAMVATQRGARVVLVGRGGWRLERVRELGIAECVDSGAEPDLGAALQSRFDGRGADVAVDATGQPEVWELAIDAVGRGGAVVFFGGCTPGTRITVDTRRAHYEELALVGAFHHTPELIRRAVDLVESEKLVPDRLVSHTMGLADVPSALDLMAEGRALKVLIDPTR
jgi:L-iditol 2-dehydrogenase